LGRPHSRAFFFLPPSPWLLDIWVVFLMQNVALDAALLFGLNAAILGWLLAAVQPKKAASGTLLIFLFLWFHISK
jgi:hypothetical protein